MAFMELPSSFIGVRKLFVDYRTSPGVVKSLLGGQAQTHSVLRDVSFALDQGTWVTVFGKPGAGKTTLLRTLAGVLKPSSGHVIVNGKSPQESKNVAAGYISRDESEPRQETAHDILYAFGTTHGIGNLPARIGEVAEMAGLSPVLHRAADQLSTIERLRLNIARAALSESPLILFDDTADELGIDELKGIMHTLFTGRTVVIATRFVATAEALSLPMLLLHGGSLVHSGTCDEIANSMACPRIVDVWIEGLRYDLLRKLRQHSGVIDVRLLPSSRFSGQRLRITLHSARYLPSLYDMISQAPLVKVQELPASLNDILSRL